MDVFEEVGLGPSIAIMRYLVSEDIVRNSQTEEALYRSRATLDSIFGDSTELNKMQNKDSGHDNPYDYGSDAHSPESHLPDDNFTLPPADYHSNYLESTEDGFPGLLPPSSAR